MTRRTLILFCLGTLLAAGTVLAQPAPMSPPPGGPAGWDAPPPAAGRLFAMLDRLELTDQQREQVEELLDEARQQQLATRKELLRLRNELQGEMLQDEPDVGKVRALAKKIGELRTSQRIKRLETRLAVRKLLTDEQQDRLIMMRGRQGRMGRRGGCHQGPVGRGPGNHGPAGGPPRPGRVW